MKTAAVIAEYNPFHNGHQYQLEETRKETGADFLLVVMSGNFVQRGAPAIVNKYARTKAALLGGADVVIELPALYALSSAEFFAGGAVTLLNRLNVVDFLSFGSESGNIALLESCARILAEKETELNSAIMPLLKNGVSYPAAREQALAAAVSGLSSAFASDISPETLTGLLGSPNNILGLEYCKALFSLHSNIRPFTLKRTDRGYHDTVLSPCDISGSGADGNCVSIPGPASGSAAAAGTSLGSASGSAIAAETASESASGSAPGLASASAIRKAMSRCPEAVRNYVPEITFPFLTENFIPVTEDSFSHLLHYKLLADAPLGFSEYLDCTPDLSDKICKNLPSYTGFTDFCGLLKSRELTYTRISRVLMHILLDIKTPEAFKFSLADRKLFVPYARLLGFRQGSEPLLAEIKKSSSIPLLSKMADARFLLDERALALLTQDVYCASVYESAVTCATGRPVPNEWKMSPVIVSRPE